MKKSTFVTKTRKIYGHHVYWLSRQQRKAIGSAACRKGFEIEIKTDETLGLCTLPGSAHKEDPNFRYLAVGTTDHILANDILYDLLLEMFKDCIVNGKLDDNVEKENKKQEQKEQQSKSKENNTRDNSRVIKNLITLSHSNKIKCWLSISVC